MVNLSSHPYGCRVVQRVMERCDMPRVLEAIVGDILANCMALAADQYGNYVIQHTLINGPPHARWVATYLPVLSHQTSIHTCTRWQITGMQSMSSGVLSSRSHTCTVSSRPLRCWCGLLS